jgi:hypothetical protein
MTKPETIEAPDLGDNTLLLALGGGEQIDPDHWVQRIHNIGQVVGFHVHHRDGKKWSEQRVLFAPLLDLAPTDPDASPGQVACPSCGEILRPNVLH